MHKDFIIVNEKEIFIHPVFSNYAASKDGDIINLKTRTIRKPFLINSGYYQLLICDKSLDKPKHYLFHRFIFEAIRGVIPEGFEINHRNAIKLDNKIKNLELVIHKQMKIQMKKRVIILLKKASIKLEIDESNISKICLKRKYNKTATSKKDGNKYRFEFA